MASPARSDPFSVRASVTADGRELVAASDDPAISGDGRTLAFVNGDQRVVEGGNGDLQVYVVPRRGGALERVSVNAAGRPGNKDSIAPSLSSDGRFVAFQSVATDLAPDDANSGTDVFLADRLAGTLALVSAAPGGGTAPGRSDAPIVSADGRYVAFQSTAPGLAPDDADAVRDVLVYDRTDGRIERASIAFDGGAANGASRAPDISANGRFVAFASSASNLVTDDVDTRPDGFVRDRTDGTTRRINTTAAGGEGGASVSVVAVADDGSVAAFVGIGGGLVPGASGTEIYVKTLATGAIEALGIASVAGSATRWRVDTLDLDRTGCRVAFDLVPLGSLDPGGPGGPNGTAGATRSWVHDCDDGAFSPAGARPGAAGGAPGSSREPSIDAAGRNLAFATGEATGADDRNGAVDIVLADLGETCAVDSEALTLTLSAREWVQLALPCEPPPGGDTVGAVFDELGADIRTDWTIFTWSAVTGRYAEAALDTRVRAGQGFWLNQAVADEVTVRLPAGSDRVPRDVLTPGCAPAGCAGLALTGSLRPTRWSFVGNPFDAPFRVADVRVASPRGPCRTSTGCDFGQASDPAGAGLVDRTWYRWNEAANAYDELAGSDPVEPWAGAWLAELGGVEAAGAPLLRVPYRGR